MYPGHSNWEGRQPARDQGDRIGMLLDLDQGSMTVWKNGVKMGVMWAGGLSGPLCWAVSLGCWSGANARIESAALPAQRFRVQGMYAATKFLFVPTPFRFPSCGRIKHSPSPRRRRRRKAE